MLAVLAQLLLAVLADGLEQRVATLAAALRYLDERVVNQSGDRVEDVERVMRGAHRFGRGEREPTAEDREAPEYRALARWQQRVAPFQRRFEGPVARRCGAARLAQEAAAPLQPLGDLIDAQRGRARRRELDGQRQAVEALADARGGRTRAMVVDHGRARRASALEEEVDGATRESGHAPHALARDAERLAARADDVQARTGGEQPRGEPGAALRHALAVVQHE